MPIVMMPEGVDCQQEIDNTYSQSIPPDSFTLLIRDQGDERTRQQW
ncbi:MAG: hypothetical protein F6K09_38930 [Merismopedia sp. SIO2A8]|nr:hypothetical protein [Merismopedia sp. SIO2A8]